MRNNSERLGLENKNTEESLLEVKAIAQTSDFSFIIPKHLVDLPSQGVFYPENHPLKQNPVVEIKEITAKEEDIIVNRDYAKENSTIDRLLQSVLISPKIPIEDILPGDKATMLFWLRIHSFGPDYPVSVACPSCGEKHEKTYDLNDCIATQAFNTPKDCILTENNTFVYELPKTKAKIEFRIANGKDEKDLEARLKKYDKYNVVYNRSSQELALITISINGQPMDFAKVYDQIPATDLRALRKKIREATPTTEIVTDFECSSCGHEETTFLPITTKFFWPE
jgi:rubredoxin